MVWRNGEKKKDRTFSQSKYECVSFSAADLMKDNGVGVKVLEDWLVVVDVLQRDGDQSQVWLAAWHAGDRDNGLENRKNTGQVSLSMLLIASDLFY